MQLIMLSGWRGSGKDTLADHMAARFGWRKVSFAGALKDHVAGLYGVPREWMDDRDKKEKPLLQYPAHGKDAFSAEVARLMHGELAQHEGALYHTPRSLLILEGSVKRSVDPDYWVKRALIPGWEDSPGARAEVALAQFLQIPTYCAETGGVLKPLLGVFY